MKRIKNVNLLKIGEVAKGAGVSVSTVHYYMQQNLLTPPVKTSRNMAYYAPQTVEEIKLIQELQAKKYLPLSAIKLLLKAKREGQGINHIEDMKGFMEDIFQPAENEKSFADVSLSELITSSGLPEASIKALQKSGLIVPVKTERGTVYNHMDILIAQAVKKLTGYGLEISDLDIMGKNIESIREEAKGMHEVFHRLANHEQVPLRDLLKIFKELKDYLVVRVLREEAGRYHDEEDGGHDA